MNLNTEVLETNTVTAGNLEALNIEDNKHLQGLSAEAFAFYTQLLVRAPNHGDIVDASTQFPYPFESPATVAELKDAGLLEVARTVDTPHDLVGYYLPCGEQMLLPVAEGMEKAPCPVQLRAV